MVFEATRRRWSGGDGHVVGFIDIGTNSCGSCSCASRPADLPVINLQREVVRLGEEEFADHLLRAAAIERAVLVCRSFAGSPQSRRRRDRRVATSATREARNQNTFVARLRDEADSTCASCPAAKRRVSSTGCAESVELGERIAFCLDIGGGSTR